VTHCATVKVQNTVRPVSPSWLTSVVWR